MATIKSYTNLGQSRKLAEFLPNESADQTWQRIAIAGANLNAQDKLQYKHNGDVPFIYSSGTGVPCWSLAALLDVLPTYLFEFDRGIDLNVYPNLNGRGWHCSYMPNCIENMKTDKFKLITNGNTLVDACVAMIEELRKFKML